MPDDDDLDGATLADRELDERASDERDLARLREQAVMAEWDADAARLGQQEWRW